MAFGGFGGWMQQAASSSIGIYQSPGLQQAQLAALLAQQGIQPGTVMSGNYSEAAQVLRVVPATTGEIDQIVALKERFIGPASVKLWLRPVDPDAARAALRALHLHINDGLKLPPADIVLLDQRAVADRAVMGVVGNLLYAVNPVASTGFTVNDSRFYHHRDTGEWAYDRVHDLVCGHTFQQQSLARARYVEFSQATGKPPAWIIEAMRLSMAAVEAGAWLYASAPDAPAAVMYTRPTVRLDENNALHAERAPAIHWPDMPDMPVVYCSHGVRMPERYVMQPEKITAQMVTDETNAEQRRELMRLIGYERYVREGGFTLVSDAKREFPNGVPKGLLNAKLWLKSWPLSDQEAHMTTFGNRVPEPHRAVLLELQNSSKEPDGSYKTYFLRVPPEMRKVADAAAWTFGMNGREYLELAAET